MTLDAWAELLKHATAHPETARQDFERLLQQIRYENAILTAYIVCVRLSFVLATMLLIKAGVVLYSVVVDSFSLDHAPIASWIVPGCWISLALFATVGTLRFRRALIVRRLILSELLALAREAGQGLAAARAITELYWETVKIDLSKYGI